MVNCWIIITGFDINTSKSSESTDLLKLKILVEIEKPSLHGTIFKENIWVAVDKGEAISELVKYISNQ